MRRQGTSSAEARQARIDEQARQFAENDGCLSRWRHYRDAARAYYYGDKALAQVEVKLARQAEDKEGA